MIKSKWYMYFLSHRDLNQMLNLANPFYGAFNIE